MLLPKDELNMQPEDSTKIFRGSNLDRYIDRPDQQFWDGKYSIINSFCLTEFLGYYTLLSRFKTNISYKIKWLLDHKIAIIVFWSIKFTKVMWHINWW